MIKIICLSVIFLLLLFLHPQQVFAAFNFSTSKQTISDIEELTVEINLDLASTTANNTYYLRGAFYKEGTTKYFGATINKNGDFYNGPYSDCQNLYQITVDASGDWSGEIKVKADPTSAYFEGSGDYFFKVGRYTTSCNITWADSAPIKIAITQTVFPSPSPSSNYSTPPTSIIPPKSPSPSPKNSPSPSPKSPSPSPKKSPAAILGEKEENLPSSTPAQTPSPSPSPSPSPQTSLGKTKVAGILTGAGLVIIGASIGFFLWYQRTIKPKEEDKD